MNEILLYEHYLATWNIKGLCDADAFENMMRHIVRCKIRIAAIQDIRWIGDTRNSYSSGNYTVYYSGCDQLDMLGTGFVVDDRLKDSVLDFIPVDERISVLRVKYAPKNLSLVSVIAPTDQEGIEKNDAFYYRLERTYDSLPSKDVKMILGNFNARVGRDKSLRSVLGRHSQHFKCDENGVRLVKFVTTKDMVVQSTCFKHDFKHKATMVREDGQRFQIDHCLIDRKSRSNITDIKPCSTPNSGTNHVLLRIKYRPVSTMVEVNAFRGVAESECSNEAIGERFEEGMDEREDSYDEDSWYNRECESMLNERNEARKRMLLSNSETDRELYRQKRKMAKKECRKAKRFYDKKNSKYMFY